MYTIVSDTITQIQDLRVLKQELYTLKGCYCCALAAGINKMADELEAVLSQKTAQHGCDHHNLMMMLHSMFGSNNSGWNDVLEMVKHNNCHGNTTSFNSHQPLYGTGLHWDFGQDVYGFLTPFVILIGIVGHGISLVIFTSPALRRLSASLYLAAISVCDICVLLTYVLLDWFKKGLNRWPGEFVISIIDNSGFCEVFLFIAYTFRFISVWLIVVFTMERFIAVCKPLHRRRICTKSFSRKIIGGVALTALLVSLYKPLLSGVHNIGGEEVCGANPNHSQLNFILDSLYGLLITAIPFLIITMFNFVILHRLLSRDILEKHGKRGSGVVFRGNMLRLEFTFILLAISSCFICLNIPYFIVWVRTVFLQGNPPGGSNTTSDSIDVLSEHSVGKSSTQLYLTRTVFYFNYCVNFFLYCLTGRQYREQIRCLFHGRRRKSLRSSQRVNSFSTQHSILQTHTPTRVTVQQCGNGITKETIPLNSTEVTQEL